MSTSSTDAIVRMPAASEYDSSATKYYRVFPKVTLTTLFSSSRNGSISMQTVNGTTNGNTNVTTVTPKASPSLTASNSVSAEVCVRYRD